MRGAVDSGKVDRALLQELAGLGKDLSAHKKLLDLDKEKHRVEDFNKNAKELRSLKLLAEGDK